MVTRHSNVYVATALPLSRTGVLYPMGCDTPGEVAKGNPWTLRYRYATRRRNDHSLQRFTPCRTVTSTLKTNRWGQIE